MPDQFKYQATIKHLATLHPPKALLLVGAGTGVVVKHYLKLGVSSALIIEPNKCRLEKLSKVIEAYPGWTLHNDLISKAKAEEIYYEANNINENGLIKPESLKPLWQNLATIKQQNRQATTLKAFIKSKKQTIDTKQINWLHIDCLPTQTILQGAGKLLKKLDVVISRAILDETILPTHTAIGKKALDDFIEPYGFIPHTYTQEHHPLIGQVFYVRNDIYVRNEKVQSPLRKTQNKKPQKNQQSVHVKRKKKQQQQPIRTIHHLSCTGGTLFAKCIASMPQVLLLNEVDPLSTLQQHKGKPLFTPTDIISLLRSGDPKISNELIASLFINNLKTIRKKQPTKTRALVLRDHSHSHFLTGESITQRPTLRDLMKDHFKLKSILTVRDPIDSFLSMQQAGWHEHFTPATFEEYCQRYLHFLNSYKGVRLIKYEDLIASPKKTMKLICKELSLEYFKGFKKTFHQFQFSGDSGRTGDVIKERPRREIDEDLKEEIAQSDSYRDLAAKLGYESIVLKTNNNV